MTNDAEDRQALHQEMVRLQRKTAELSAELRRAQRQLEVAEADLEKFFAALPGPALLLDHETDMILQANPAACRFYGLTPAQLTDLPLAELTAGQPPALTSPHPRMRHRLADGQVREVELHLGRVKFKGREVSCGLILDLTERLQAEADLAQARTLNQDLPEAVPTGLLRVAQGQVAWANPAALELFGAPPAAGLAGRPWPGELAEAEDRESLADLGQAGPARVEASLRRLDGSVFPAEVGARPAGDPDQGRLVWVADVSRRQAAEAEAAHGRAILKALAELTDEAVLILREGQVAEANPAACRLYGAGPERLIGADFLALTGPSERAATRERLAQAEETTFASQGLAFDGRAFPAEVRLRRAISPGRPVQAVQVRDLGPARRAEDELKRERDESAALADRRAEEIAGLRRDLESAAAARREAGTVLLALVDGLPDLTNLPRRPEASGEAGFDLLAFLEATLPGLAGRAESRGRGLICRLAPATPTRLRGDVRRLGQILSLLVGQALRLDSPEKVRVKIDHRPAPAPDQTILHLTVTPLGSGRSADRDGLDPFPALALALVEALGGRLWLEGQPDQPGHGHVTLPFRLQT